MSKYRNYEWLSDAGVSPSTEADLRTGAILRTNRVPNPGNGASLAYISTVRSTPSTGEGFTRTTAATTDGQQRLQFGASTGAPGRLQVTAGEDVPVYLEARNSASAPMVIGAFFYTSSGVNITPVPATSFTATSTPGSEWTVFVGSVKAPPSADRMMLYVGTGASGPLPVGGTLDARRVMVGDTGAYFDGDTPDIIPRVFPPRNDSVVRITGQGMSITLTDTPEGLHRRPGGAGWGMAPVVNAWFEGAGDGARLRSTRRTQRELSIPIDVLGTSRASIENALRQLVQIVREPFQIHVDRTSGESFYIDAVYESGLEGVYSTSPSNWNQLALIAKCPDPYWTSEAVQTFKVAPVPAPYPFVQRLSALPVASAAAFGQVSIENTGDVESRPTWTVQGPGNTLTLNIAGDGLVLNRNLTATNIITIKHDGNGWTITDETGSNQYPLLATTPAPVFPVIPKGTSLATVSMAGTTTASFIRATYPERREVVY